MIKVNAISQSLHLHWTFQYLIRNISCHTIASTEIKVTTVLMPSKIWLSSTMDCHLSMIWRWQFNSRVTRSLKRISSWPCIAVTILLPASRNSRNSRRKISLMSLIKSTPLHLRKMTYAHTSSYLKLNIKVAVKSVEAFSTLRSSKSSKLWNSYNSIPKRIS